MGGSQTTNLKLEVDAYDGAEQLIRDFLSFLQHSKRIKRFDLQVICKEQPSPFFLELFEKMEQWKDRQQLVRLQAVKSRGRMLDICCKILNYDTERDALSVYDVDKKQVELLKLNEIQDIHPA